MQQENITIIDIYAQTPPRPSKHMKQKWAKSKGEMDSSTVTVGNFNTSLSMKGRTTK